MQSFIIISAIGSMLAGVAAWAAILYSIRQNHKMNFDSKDCENYRDNNDHRFLILEKRFEADHKEYRAMRTALIFLVVKADGDPKSLGLVVEN